MNPDIRAKFQAIYRSMIILKNEAHDENEDLIAEICKQMMDLIEVLLIKERKDVG